MIDVLKRQSKNYHQQAENCHYRMNNIFTTDFTIYYVFIVDCFSKKNYNIARYIYLSIHKRKVTNVAVTDDDDDNNNNNDDNDDDDICVGKVYGSANEV